MRYYPKIWDIAHNTGAIPQRISSLIIPQKLSLTLANKF
jgi:hypothetical protein